MWFPGWWVKFGIVCARELVALLDPQQKVAGKGGEFAMRVDSLGTHPLCVYVREYGTHTSGFLRFFNLYNKS